MTAQTSKYQRLLLIVLIVLYGISLAAFTYANWQVEPEHIIWGHALNAIILSIPLVLFYSAIYVLLSAWHEHRQTGQVSPRLANLIHRAPRLAALAIIFFVGLFSLDVFDMEGTPLELLGGFILHSLPSIAMIVLLVFAWRRPMIGFVAFLVAGLFFLRFVFFGMGLGHFMLFSGPLLLISALFYVDWRWLGPRRAPTLDSPA